MASVVDAVGSHIRQPLEVRVLRRRAADKAAGSSPGGAGGGGAAILTLTLVAHEAPAE